MLDRRFKEHDAIETERLSPLASKNQYVLRIHASLATLAALATLATLATLVTLDAYPLILN